MPIDAQPKQNQISRLSTFVGVNLDVDPLLLQPNELQEGLDIDLHTEPGSILSRAGQSAFGVLTSEACIIRDFKSKNYILTSTEVYENLLSIGSFDESSKVSILEFQPLNGLTSEVYVATETGMFRVASGTLVPWGITGRANAPVLSAVAGNNSGTYGVAYTYARRANGGLVSESNLSPSRSITVSSEGIAAAVEASTDSQVTHIRVYRTQASGTVLLFDREIENITTTVTLSSFDAGLGSQGPEDNDPPALGGLAVSHSNRVFVARGNKLYYSQRFEPEVFPALNFIEIGAPNEFITGLVSSGGQLGVFTSDTKYRIVEQVAGVQAIGQALPFFGGTNNQFFAIEATSKRGTPAFASVIDTPQGVAYVSRDGIFLTDLNQDTKISNGLQKLFLGETTNQGSLETMHISQAVSALYKDRLYFSMPSFTGVFSLDLRTWSFYSTVYSALKYEEKSDTFYSTANKIVRLLEIPTNDSFTLTFSFKTAEQHGDDPYLSKLFLWVIFDVEIPATATVTATLNVDGVSKKVVSLTGSRGRQVMRIPPGVIGKTWNIEVEGTYRDRLKIHGAQIIWKPRAVI